VVYLELGETPLYPSTLLKQYGIGMVKGFDVRQMQDAIKAENSVAEREIKKINIKKITDIYQKD
jgi:hypothetical protein